MPTGRLAAGLALAGFGLLAVSGLIGARLRHGAGLERVLEAGAATDRGVWLVPASDLYEIAIDPGVDARLLLNGSPVLTSDPSSATRVVWLDRGAHEVAIEYADAAPPGVPMRAGRAGRGAGPVPIELLLPAAPANLTLRYAAAATRLAAWLLGVVALAASASLGLYLIGLMATPVLARRLDVFPRLTFGHAIRTALVLLVVSYAGLLRFDALAQTRGPVDRPELLRELQRLRLGDSALRPSSMRWQRVEGRYISDPYTYLQYARDMQSFYAAHRREPVFPFATKVSLAVLDDQDVAVSFASAFFSVLAVAATFLVGASACSYWVGLGAATGMAVEQQLITTGVEGWRDDAFTCAVLFVVLALLRVARAPTWRSASILGLTAGLTCLVRITSLSFVVPGLVWVTAFSARGWRARRDGALLALLTMSVVAGPFLVNCWRVYGDPFYAINVHADVYRQAEGEVTTTSQTTGEYLSSKWRARPADAADTTLLGLTRYPFANKWTGFVPWHPDLGRVLAVASLAGLVLFAALPAGRLMLVVLVTSLVPYAATWRLIGDWRFTQHAYPFFMIAAMFALARLVTLVWPSHRDRLLAALRPRPVAAGLALLFCLAGGAWLMTRTLPVLVTREAIRLGEDVNVTAGDRDWSFLGTGWSRRWTEGVVSARAMTDPVAHLWLPLAAARDYDLVIRLDPFPRPLEADWARRPVVHAYLNDRPLATLRLAWNPERVGAYDLRVPAALVADGWNRFTLLSPSGEQVRFWYVRIRHPAGLRPSGTPRIAIAAGS